MSELNDINKNDDHTFSSPAVVIGIILSYLIFTYLIGPRFMKNRPAFRLKLFLSIYNIMQVAICLYAINRIWKLASWDIFDFKNCVEYLPNTPERRAFDDLTFKLFLLKIFELTDTVMFVLRKKQNQITYLHVFHHASTITIVYLVLNYYRDLAHQKLYNMGPFTLVLLALQFFHSTTLSKVLNTPLYAVNSINDKLNDYFLHLPAEFSNENDEILDDDDVLTDLTDIPDDDLPLVQTFEDKTELTFRQPIESVNFDYLRNAVILKFHKNNAKAIMKMDSMENEKKKSLQDNFIRFGKRSYEEYPWENSVGVGFIDKTHGARLERDHQTARDPRGDNFMRFGRSVNAKNDFMRFGRGTNDDFMRFGRSPSTDFMRFGRASGQDFMRFGRTPSQDFMRFGRTPNQDFMRFGRAGKDNFMRFGRNSNKVPVNTNFMRNSRPDNFMRFGRTPVQKQFDNFMRFGKSLDKSNDNNGSHPLLDKNGLKQAVKLIHDADKNADNENPVDKAIKVLFDKHQQKDSNNNAHSEELKSESSYQSNDSNDLDLDSDYFLKMTK